MKRILIVEDDPMISEIVRYNLEKEGYAAEVSEEGPNGLSLALSGRFDLVLLDVMLPGMDGFEICRRVREKSDLPIIMLTAREEETDKVLGLDLGADDYVTKPFSMKELLARVRSNTRRNTPSEPLVEDGEVITLGGVRVYKERHEAVRDGDSLDLTLREYELLKFLAENRDKVFSREELMEKVWGYDYYGDLRAVDVTVRRLREKLEPDPANPLYLHTRRGVGYYCSFKG